VKITGWNRPFDDPIPLPRGCQLVTLEDAGNYKAPFATSKSNYRLSFEAYDERQMRAMHSLTKIASSSDRLAMPRRKLPSGYRRKKAGI
jgi:hypothetical protein